MNVAIIIAGGVGSRMGQKIPKRFFSLMHDGVQLHFAAGFDRNIKPPASKNLEFFRAWAPNNLNVIRGRWLHADVAEGYRNAAGLSLVERRAA